MDIIEATLNGNTQLVSMLLSNGADINLQKNDGWTALMLAARYSNTDSNVETVKLLLDNGADINLQKNDGWTALMLAARYSNIETVKLLLDNGADTFIKNNTNKITIDYCLTNECKSILFKYMFNLMYNNDKRLANQYSKTGDMQLPKEIWELILLRKRQQQLCKDLSNDKNRDLLIAFAEFLEIPIPDNTSKGKLCGIISQQLVWGGKYSLESSNFTNQQDRQLKETLISVAYRYGINIDQPLDKILTDLSLFI
jgi:hypothetical protein